MSDVPSEDVVEIRALLGKMRDAWARGDAVAYAECFSEDSDYVTYNGIRLRGREQNAAMHDALFRTVLKGSTISPSIESIDLLSGEIALVHSVGSGRKKSRQTYVFVKRAGRWQIRSFQNTHIQPVSIWVTRVLLRRREISLDVTK